MSSLLPAVIRAILFSITYATHMKTIPVEKVSGLMGGTAALPCHAAHPAHDSIHLLLWFRDHLTTPIYRLDGRLQGQGEGRRSRHWPDQQRFGSRASLEVSSPAAVLRIASLTLADQGLYTCRVDFRLQPTKTTRVNLTVVVPPESVSVVVSGAGGSKEAVASVVGPYKEGEMLVLTCIAHGGEPRPSVVWFEDTHLLDSHMESHQQTNTTQPPSYASNTTTSAPGPTISTTRNEASTTNEIARTFVEEPYNTLTLGPLTRNDLKLLLTCEASNNNLTLPTSMVVMVDMNLPPLSVSVRAPQPPLTAGREYRVACEVRGSRPPPEISWYKTDARILGASHTTSADGNVTSSNLVFTPKPQDNGSFLRCIAETKAVSASMEDIWNLTVYYVPSVAARFGSSLDSTNIKEGDDVYFECSIQANPQVSQVSWRHNNQVLNHSVSEGVIISNQSLVLQQVVRTQGGLYSCHAHNLVGDGSSSSLRLDVKYAPVCSPGQVTTYAVGRHEDAEVSCSVRANPPRASFHWTFNSTSDAVAVPPGRFASSGGSSLLTYTPVAPLDYGTLLCRASNEIGTQREPCVFRIVPAGKPEPPSNCTVGRRSRSSVMVRCDAGSSGGLPQRFLLQAKLHQGHHTINLTAAKPTFLVESLEPGRRYELMISAFNDKGSSASAITTFSTSLAPTGSAYQPHDGPSEAEVRDGSRSGGSAISDVGGSGGDNTYLGLLASPALIPVALGTGAALILIIIVLILLITFRTRLPHHQQQHHHHHHRPRQQVPDRLQPPLAAPQTTCLHSQLQVEGESDAEPDVIPPQEDSSSSPSPEKPLAAVLLLPHAAHRRLRHPPVPGCLAATADLGRGAAAVSSSSSSPSVASLAGADPCGLPLPCECRGDVGGRPPPRHPPAQCSSTLPRAAPRHPSRGSRPSCCAIPGEGGDGGLSGEGGDGGLPPLECEGQGRGLAPPAVRCGHPECRGGDTTGSTLLLSKREESSM